MCCALASLLFFGPRVAAVVWWLLDISRWSAVFPSIIWPILGIIFLPITTLIYVLVFPGGISSLDWVLIIVAVIIDLGAYGGGIKSRSSN